jgi:hypothetical protein
MLDYCLGGGHNLAADRDLVRRLATVIPIGAAARAQRGFQNRAVWYLAAAGITHFLDLDGGVLPVGATHELVPHRVIYVQPDPAYLLLSRTITRRLPAVTVIDADPRHPRALLATLTRLGLLRVGTPLGVLLGAMPHYLSDQALRAVLTSYRAVLPPGSKIVLTQFTGDEAPFPLDAALTLYRDAGRPITTRTRHQLRALLTGYDLDPPGIVPSPDWRPEPGRFRPISLTYAAVATVPPRRP